MSVTTDNRLAEKAQRYLAERRVQIVSVHRKADGWLGADVLVYGSRETPYSVVKWGDLPWHCDCMARVEICSHVVAAALVIPEQVGDRG